MDYEKLKEVIAKQIKKNGRGEITGPILQASLLAMVDSLGEVYPQTYTDEQKAQARANIDALANYDGEITKEKLSAEVQAILDDVANKQNITDESLATIAKTIVGAINEVYKGGLEDGSIATNKIEDGAVTEDKLAPLSVSSKKIKYKTIGASKLGEKSVTEPKLSNELVAKVNNNVKTVEQALTDEEIAQASKNLKLRDDSGNFFADKKTYDAVAKLVPKPQFSVFGTKCIQNTFGEYCNHIKFGNCCVSNKIKRQCDNNLFGNKCVSNLIGDYCQGNTFGNCCENNELGVHCNGNTFGNFCNDNKLGDYCQGNTFGNFCTGNEFGVCIMASKIDDGVSYVQLKSNAIPEKSTVAYIHILSGVQGESSTEKLVINIPDECLNSFRTLIITTKVTNGSPSTPEDLVMYYADEVVDKQNKQDSTLETTSKEVVGAINELFNGGVKNNSITTEKLKDQAVTTDKIADNSITMSKLKKALSSFPDIGMAVYHQMKVVLSGYGIKGSYTMESNGVTITSSNALEAVDTMTRKLGAVASFWISEPKDEDGHTNEYLGIITSVNMPTMEITAIVRHYGTRKDYFVTIKNYKFATKICLTDQLPKIASLETDVTNLQGKVEAKIKVLSSGTDLKKDVTEAGIYILSGTATYLNAPNNWEHYNAAILIVTGDNSDSYNRGKTILGFQTGSRYPFAATLRNNEWVETDLETALKGKLDSTSTLSDTEVNNIWDNN